MNIFRVDKIIDRLNRMLDNAIEGKTIENSFDETKVSALETKLNRYLTITQTSGRQLEAEKNHVKELVSDISHQTKTPIANILLYSQLLEEMDLPEDSRVCMKALTSQAEKLQFLIDSLVKTSRLETGIITVTPKLQEVQPLLDHVCQQVATKAEVKNISIVGCQTGVSAIYDLKWTSESLYNILDNGVKYTKSGGKIMLSVSAFELFCKIDVTDNGIGIVEEEQSKIFSRFYRSASVREEEGVGIGLFLAREIISRQGGYIKVKSGLKQGSTFSIYLPRGE